MKHYFFTIFFLFTQFINAQSTIQGKVTNANNTPLEGAAVYLNNTTIGMFTDSKGNFILTAPDGIYQLIISYLGNKTQQISINTSSLQNPLHIKLLANEVVLDEVEIKKNRYDNNWYHNLATFKKALFGNTKLALQCKILNPKVLYFDFNQQTGLFTAFAKEPIEIIHKGLGYQISYDLVDFKMKKNIISYIGYIKYQNLIGSKRKQKKWKKNREKAYLGSIMHFVRSLYSKNLKEQGYVINQFKRVPNPERPTEQEITKARNLLKNSKVAISFSKPHPHPITAIDSAASILSKTHLPRYKDYLYKKNVPYSDMIVESESSISLKFTDYLSITYLLEPEETNYLYQSAFNPKKKTGVQSSAITLLAEHTQIEPDGNIINPLDIIVEGYWEYEKFAVLLPLDYYPK